MWKSREARRKKFFGDILSPEITKTPTIPSKRQTNDLCRQLSIEVGIYRKPLIIKGEGGVTE